MKKILGIKRDFLIGIAWAAGIGAAARISTLTMIAYFVVTTALAIFLGRRRPKK